MAGGLRAAPFVFVGILAVTQPKLLFRCYSGVEQSPADDCRFARFIVF
jgi:hypothetical protein